MALLAHGLPVLWCAGLWWLRASGFGLRASGFGAKSIKSLGAWASGFGLGSSRVERGTCRLVFGLGLSRGVGVHVGVGRQVRVGSALSQFREAGEVGCGKIPGGGRMARGEDRKGVLTGLMLSCNSNRRG